MKFSNDPIHPQYNHDQWIEKNSIEDHPLNELPTIPEFFANREIFVTGGTGFIGKTLIEKLLRTCPDIKAIYLLIRPKKDKDIKDRLKSTFDSILFDLLRKKNPNFMEKLIPIAGDVAELELGMSEEDKQRIKNVSVVYHSAASVRFDDPICHAVFMNTRGTRELLELTKTFNDFKVFVHISTAYSNCHMETIEEKIYPPLADWREAIEICEKLNKGEHLDALTRHFTEFMPNTYTFTKHLAEQVINDYKDKLPIVLVRPSVVLNAIDDPLGGYVDNFNGPIGLLCGMGTGLVKTLNCDPNNVMDMISVDIVIRALIIATWKRAYEAPDTLPIYNAAFSSKIKLSIKNMTDLTFSGPFEEFPLGRLMLSIPNCTISSCRYRIKIEWFLFQFIPALMFDFILSFTGNKLKIMKLQRKVYEAAEAIRFFISNDFFFKVDNFNSLSGFLKADDIRAFDIRRYENYSPILCGRNWMYGLRKYLMNLKDEDLEADRRYYKRFEKIDFIVKNLIFWGFIYFLLRKFKDFL